MDTPRGMSYPIRVLRVPRNIPVSDMGHVSLWECWCFIAYMQGCQNGYELGIGFFHFVIVRGGQNVKRIENQISI